MHQSVEDVMNTIHANARSRTWPWLRLRVFAAAMSMTMAFAVSASDAAAQVRYSSPDEAVAALIKAAKSGDPRGLTQVLGPEGGDIVYSGDPVADAANRTRFTDAFDAKHQVVMEGTDKATLIVGPDDWPFPIPLVRKDGAWRFDTAAGRTEILYRRIGRNELNAIQTCLAYVDAQQDYAEKGVDSSGVYAQRIKSRPGRKDGLYWPARPGEDESPLGELAATASAEGYTVRQERVPYHGYYYRILFRQGASAPGGALDYVVRGKMIGGFALVAYPAEYGNSGVMTFLVNHQGIVYEKDLGPRTSVIASRMLAFNPDVTWRRVAEPSAAKQ
jgi:hypothetical protein